MGDGNTHAGPVLRRSAAARAEPSAYLVTGPSRTATARENRMFPPGGCSVRDRRGCRERREAVARRPGRNRSAAFGARAAPEAWKGRTPEAERGARRRRSARAGGHRPVRRGGTTCAPGRIATWRARLPPAGGRAVRERRAEDGGVRRRREGAECEDRGADAVGGLSARRARRGRLVAFLPGRTLPQAGSRTGRRMKRTGTAAPYRRPDIPEPAPDHGICRTPSFPDQGRRTARPVRQPEVIGPVRVRGCPVRRYRPRPDRRRHHSEYLIPGVLSRFSAPIGRESVTAAVPCRPGRFEGCDGNPCAPVGWQCRAGP